MDGTCAYGTRHTQNDMILTDSLLVVNQIYGNWKMNDLAVRCGELCARARELIEQKQLTLAWITRDQNLAGRKIEKNRKNKIT